MAERDEDRGCARRVRRWWPVAAVALGLLIATAMCIVRLAWIGVSFGPGGSRVVSITIAHGNVEYRVSGSTQPTGRTRWVFNRQVELGLRPRFHGDWAAGNTRVEVPAAPVCAAMAAAGAGTLMIRRLRRGPRPGHCRCGYSLAGLAGDVCPECGGGAAAGRGARVGADQRRV